MTIKDIARLCGVSVSTVSRVLNEKPDVSPAVRAAVLEAVRSSNYVPNNSARDLVKISSDAVGLVVKGVSNPFYADIIKAVEREIDAAGCTMVMQQIDISEDEVARGASMEREKKLRGLILLGGRSDYSAQDLGTITVPFVCCSFTNSFGTLSRAEYSAVSIEDEETAARAVRELHRLGHRRIAALVSERDDRSISELRCRGYTRALRECGLEPDPALVACAGSFGMRDAYEATMRLLDSGEEFSAIFCISDMMAIAAIKALGPGRARGLLGDRHRRAGVFGVHAPDADHAGAAEGAHGRGERPHTYGYDRGPGREPPGDARDTAAARGLGESRLTRIFRRDAEEININRRC